MRQNGLAVVTPDAQDGIALAVKDCLMFYDCGTPTREWASDEPPQRAVRGWLWRLKDDPIWQKGRPAFMIVADGKTWKCTVGVFVPASMSAILNPSDTVEFF
jgi:hypothetical protein